MLAKVLVIVPPDDRANLLQAFNERTLARTQELEEEQTRVILEEPINELLRKGVNSAVIIRTAQALALA